jgi:hypothetical protein
MDDLEKIELTLKKAYTQSVEPLKGECQSAVDMLHRLNLGNTLWAVEESFCGDPWQIMKIYRNMDKAVKYLEKYKSMDSVSKYQIVELEVE